MLDLNKNNFIFLQKLLKNNFFSSTDYFFSKIFKPSEEDVAIFLSYLFFISTKGNLSLKIENNDISPNLINLENIEDKKKLEKLIISGSKKNNEKFIFEPKDDLSLSDKIIVKRSIFFYLQKNYFLETQILKNLNFLITKEPKDIFQKKIFEENISYLKKDNILNNNQLFAIQNAKNNVISIITGGPGSGKTYSVRYLIQTFLNSLNIEKKDFKIVICAPTGKAKSHLEKKILPYFSNASIDSKTLHSLLKVNRNKNTDFNQSKLIYDLIIVDEASMIDAKLMAQLLGQIHENSRLILIGDDFQLSPVDAGNIFYELCNIDKIKKIFLDKNIRFENEKLYNLSLSIKNKDINNFFKQFDQECIKFYDTNSNIEIRNEIFNFIEKNYIFNKDLDPANALENVSKYKILTSKNLGVLGIEKINQLIFNYILSKTNSKSSFYIPIMISKNDYDKNLFNGDIGVCISKKENIHDLTKGNFYFFEKDKLRKFSFYEINRFEIAFCISVHKSQGSEYDDLLFYLPSSIINFGNEILYTAITRSKKTLTVISDKKNLADVLLKFNKKTSALRNRMAN
ncbi:MAG: RecBCD enzyme subunit RecD [Candidatus Anoxychlamydiales bacterium]|nr:RecBCD enzyme subunit RecD [Candidatus Anoxychlamydiales bacterium]